MRNLLLLLVLTVLVGSCASTNRLHSEALHYALVGHDESTIHSRLGVPQRTIAASEGQKIMIYEFYSKGIFETPYKSKVKFNARRSIMGNSQELTFNSNSTKTNDPKYTVYQEDLSSLKVFLNKEGYCFQLEENLTKDQLATYYEQFKGYIPKEDKKTKIR